MKRGVLSIYLPSIVCVMSFVRSLLRTFSIHTYLNLTINNKHAGRYARSNKDDTPLYVFDWAVYEDDEIGREVMAQYRVPSIFGEDLFSLLEERQHSDYPSYRSEKQYVIWWCFVCRCVHTARERERERESVFTSL